MQGFQAVTTFPSSGKQRSEKVVREFSADCALRRIMLAKLPVELQHHSTIVQSPIIIFYKYLYRCGAVRKRITPTNK